MAQAILQFCIARGGQEGFITYSLVHTITSSQYGSLISRASGEFGIPTQNDIVGLHFDLC